jgi:hypothetical protein
MSALRDELLRLAADHNKVLKPADVVNAARPEDAPLHRYFEWDDAVAGEQYRIHQAHDYIRVTVHVLERPDQEPIKVRAFVSLTPDRGPEGFYRLTADVYSDTDYKAQMFADAKREMEAFEHKYRMLPELEPVFAMMRELLNRNEQAA